MKKIIFVILGALFLSIQTSNAAQNDNFNQNTWYQPKIGTSWQLQLTGEINTKYDVNLYDVDLIETPQNVIDDLQSKGKKVICYFSAGSWEKFRDDAKDFPKDVIGKKLAGWPDEKWLNIAKYEKFADIMKKRLDLAVQKKCDGVDPDNVDGYQNKNGFNLTYKHQLEYNKWLSTEAHKRNLAIGLKNDLDQIKDLVNDFDFAVNEECFTYNECNLLLPFTKQKKAVLGVEYKLNVKKFCKKANDLNFSFLKMNYDLEGSRISCN